MIEGNRMQTYTTVVGVDAKHLEQLDISWPTWKKNKSGTILSHPMIVFRDYEQVSEKELRFVVDHPDLTVYAWPMGGAEYAGDNRSKWTDAQRHKMLAGFVHVPAMFVQTDYFLKLDCDVVAIGEDDWINPEWFADEPAIVSHPWGYTKPPDQMVRLDRWVEDHPNTLPVFEGTNPLNLHPEPGANKVKHKRIISWCSFFKTDVARDVAKAATLTCGPYQIPVPSQDGFMFYIAKRMGLPIKRVNMKRCGWRQLPNTRRLREFVEGMI